MQIVKWTNILSNIPCRFFVGFNICRAVIKAHKQEPRLVLKATLAVCTFFVFFNGIIFLRLIYSDVIVTHGVKGGSLQLRFSITNLFGESLENLKISST